MSKVSPRRAHTQDRLLDAAIALFAEKGVLGTSVEELCERAGFSRGAFYSNFASKDELLLAVLARKGDEVLAAARRATASVPGEQIEPATADEVIRQAMVVFLASHPTDRQWLLAREEMRLYALRNPSVRTPLRAVEESLEALLTEAIGDVVERQRATLSLPPRQLVMVLEAYCQELATKALLCGTEPDDEVAARLAQLVRQLVTFPQDR